MSRSTVALLLVSLLPVLTACDSASGENTYDITLLGTDENDIGRAEMTFERPGVGETVPGSFRSVSGATYAVASRLDAIGEEGGMVRVEIDRDVADGGVSFTGAFGSDPFVGTWTAGTIAGPTPESAFRGTRR